MNRDLEELLKAYDAAKQAVTSEEKRLLEAYESKFNELLDRHPGLSREALAGAIRYAYAGWLKGQRKPTALPPKA